jgi:hypothetical protein
VPGSAPASRRYVETAYGTSKSRYGVGRAVAGVVERVLDGPVDGPVDGVPRPSIVAGAGSNKSVMPGQERGAGSQI